jgi:8-oxo-dGTP pyrophosphatase MutT (NUDIX family)
LHRSNLIKLLQNYHPAAPEEVIYKKRMLEFINAQQDCFKRSLAIGHITASAWLLSADGSQALLLHHRKLDRWLQLGGHCDGNPDVLAVAIKEAQEESGIENIVAVNNQIFDIDIHKIPANSREAAHDHYHVRFLLQVIGNEKIIQNQESKELRWVGKNRLELPTDEHSVTRMFDKWLEVGRK